MSVTYTQAYRPMALTAPLPDVLLLQGLSGHEGLSQLFSFQLDLIAENGKVEGLAWDKVLGQSVTVRMELPNKQQRQFGGICSRFSQGESGTTFTEFRLEMVPRLWLLTKKAQSRIFQHETVPQILEKVLKKDWGLDVDFILPGPWQPRDFVVQYRETDFNFVSRLMEEEGIFYFFKHQDPSGKPLHKLVVANTPAAHADVPSNPAITYKNLSQSQAHDKDVIYDWSKTQEVTSGKYVLWDHTFELPHKHLEADKTIQEGVQVGKAAHKLKFGENGKLEIYDWPGEYAQRFDGVDRGGGERPAEVQKVFEDNKRTVDLRMQQEAAAGLVVQGASNCRQMVAGHKFSVTTLPSDVQTKPLKPDGVYVLTGVSHSARIGASYSSGGSGPGFDYHNSFTCVPVALPFRPQRTTPKPVVPGTQTAVVVGPKGEEIFTDKYGRIKVQFHWDRQGKNDADSSCWIRVTQPWAGKRWGGYFIPRIGQEVIVDFLEGDPDQPIVVGTVYNADQMPPYTGKGPDPKHPHDPKVSGFKTNSTPGGQGFNELRFDDAKDKEQVFMHAERNMDVRVKHDSLERVIHDRHLIVGWEKDGQKGGDQREMVYQDKHLHVHRHQEEHVEGNVKFTVGKGEAKDGGNVDVVIEKDKKELIEQNSHQHVKQNRLELVDQTYSLIAKDLKVLINAGHSAEVKGDQKLKVGGGQSLKVGGDQKEQVGGAVHLTVGGDQSTKVGGAVSLTVGGDQHAKVGSIHAVDAGQEIHLKGGMKVILEAGQQLTIKGPGGFVDIGPAGVTIQGTIVKINSGGAAGSGSGAKPKSPQTPQAPDAADQAADAAEAKPTVPTRADNAVTGYKSAPG
jgi:type VI secretion system secreted protein VgrG